MGLYNLRARWYGPRAGRFATADKCEGILCRPLSQNDYLYGEADPADNFDPSGLGVESIVIRYPTIIAGGLLTIATADSIVRANTGTSPIARGVECLLNFTASAVRNAVVTLDGAAQPLTGICTLPLQRT